MDIERNISDDEIIDRLLRYAVDYEKVDEKYRTISDMLSDYGACSKDERERIVNRIRAEELADFFNAGDGLFATQKTRLIHQMGGYVEYLKKERGENERLQAWRDMQLEGAGWQIKVNKWLYQTRIWPLVISILSLIVAIVALVLNFR